MKKITFLVLLVFISAMGFSQVQGTKISQLPTQTTNPGSGWLPIVVGSTTKKIDIATLAQTFQAVTDAGHVTSRVDVQIGGLGIGAAPTHKFDVVSGSGSMYFDGTRAQIADGSGNLLIGSLTGQQFSGNINNVGIADNTLRLAQGNYNVAIANLALQGVHGDRNTSVGVLSSTATDSSDNSSFGYGSALLNYGKRDVSLGSFAGNYIQLASGTINNSEITIPSSSVTGTTTGAFITANSLAVGGAYPFQIHFNGGIPAPYGSSTDVYCHGVVSNSNTIVFTTATFTSQGSGNFTLRLYNKQDNAIAIGYNVQTDSSNQIKIGNSSNVIFVLRNFSLDLTTAPVASTKGTLIYNGTNYVYQRYTMTTTQRDALTGSDLYEGRRIYNLTSQG
jgi:hypothetical protein